MGMSFKGSISFGLVYIPIKLHNIIKDNDIGFNMIDRKTKSRIQYKKVAIGSGEEVSQKDIVKGYQYEDNKYILMEDEDFEKIKTKKDKTISIEKFVDIEEIDPLYFDKSFYVVPEGAEKAFVLLLSAMEKEGKVGIAKSVIGSKETLIALRVKNGQMLLNTMYFNEEVQKNPIKDINRDVNPKELALAKTLIDNMKGDFKPEEYKDEYREKLMKAIETKINGNEIVSQDEVTETKVVDLMDALLKSLKKPDTEDPAKKSKQESKIKDAVKNKDFENQDLKPSKKKRSRTNTNIAPAQA